jgi:hypothetical protein
MNTRRALILLAVVTALGVLLLVWPKLQLFFQVDACLDLEGDGTTREARASIRRESRLSVRASEDDMMSVQW